MKTFLLALLSLTLLAGCGSWRVPETRVIDSYIPVYQCPIDPSVITTPEKPELFIKRIDSGSSYNEIATYYIATVEQLIEHSTELRVKLDLLKAVCLSTETSQQQEP